MVDSTINGSSCCNRCLFFTDVLSGTWVSNIIRWSSLGCFSLISRACYQWRCCYESDVWVCRYWFWQPVVWSVSGVFLGLSTVCSFLIIGYGYPDLASSLWWKFGVCCEAKTLCFLAIVVIGAESILVRLGDFPPHLLPWIFGLRVSHIIGHPGLLLEIFFWSKLWLVCLGPFTVLGFRLIFIFSCFV